MLFAEDFIEEDDGEISGINWGRLEWFLFGDAKEKTNDLNNHLCEFAIFGKQVLSYSDDIFEEEWECNLEWHVFIDVHDLDGGREELNHELFLFIDVFVLGTFVYEDTGYLKGSDDKFCICWF